MLTGPLAPAPILAFPPVITHTHYEQARVVYSIPAASCRLSVSYAAYNTGVNPIMHFVMSRWRETSEWGSEVVARSATVEAHTRLNCLEASMPEYFSLLIG